jgi:hypothetical protein
MLWNRFKLQIMMIIVSLILIVAIFGIYDDLYKIVMTSNPHQLYFLVFLKWCLVLGIGGINYYVLLKTNTTKTQNLIEHKQQDVIVVLPNKPTKQQKRILSKDKLKSKTDIILEKYTTKKIDE